MAMEIGSRQSFIMQRDWYQTGSGAGDGVPLPNNREHRQALSSSRRAAEISISEEGQSALREKLEQLGPPAEHIDMETVKMADTNEVAWEHYTAMMGMSGMELKDGNYDVEDVMQSIMDTYEVLYNQITEAHKEGDRQVSYDLTGTRSLTLEEDLAGLDRAYKMRLANLGGYIVCQQTNKAFAHPGRDFLSNRPQKEEEKQKDNFLDEEYRNTAVSMMKQAREEFLALFQTKDYRKGAAVGIITDIFHSNAEFVSKTQKLF